MIPSRRAFLFAGGVVILALLTAIDPRWQSAWGIALALLGGFMAVDLTAALLARPPQLRRQVASALPLGVESPVALRIINRGRGTLRIRCYDHYPAQFEATGLPQTISVAARAWTELRYAITPTRRGPFSFAPAQVRCESPLGLWWRDRRLGAEDRVRVYPNFAVVAKYVLLASSDRTQQMGIRKQRRRGQGSEFHQLREFRDGDSLRQVDWRATARQQRLISREYQDERDQNMVMLLDCGRRMRAQDDELSHFDHALNAMLLLTYVALRQGDAVGVATFSGEPRWLKPARGQGMRSRILNTIYDLQPSTDAPDYSRAAVDLLARQHKRSLVVILTGIRSENGPAADDDLLSAVKLLQRRHTVLLASLREQAIDALQQQTAADFRSAVSIAAARHYLDERERGITSLRNSGVNCIDVQPGRLSVALVNHYLAMKAGGRI